MRSAGPEPTKALPPSQSSASWIVVAPTVPTTETERQLFSALTALFVTSGLTTTGTAFPKELVTLMYQYGRCSVSVAQRIAGVPNTRGYRDDNYRDGESLFSHPSALGVANVPPGFFDAAQTAKEEPAPAQVVVIADSYNCCLRVYYITADDPVIGSHRLRLLSGRADPPNAASHNAEDFPLGEWFTPLSELRMWRPYQLCVHPTNPYLLWAAN